MSRRLLRYGALAGAAALLMAPSADGLGAGQSVQLSAKVEKFCKYTGISIPPGALNNMAVDSSSLSASTLHVLTPVGSNGRLQTAGFQLTLGTQCNASSRVRLTTAHGGLTPAVPVVINPTQFANKINYSATAFYNGFLAVAGLDTTDSTPPGTSSPPSFTLSGPLINQIKLLFAIDSAPTTIVAAGTYSDTLTVTLEPQ